VHPPKKKLYTSDNVQIVARRVAKFHGVAPSNPKIISANTLNFKPILALSLCKIC